MIVPDIDTLLSFLRLDRERIILEKVGVTFNDSGLQVVELSYFDVKTKELRKCVIGINGIKNALTSRQLSR